MRDNTHCSVPGCLNAVVAIRKDGCYCYTHLPRQVARAPVADAILTENGSLAEI